MLDFLASIGNYLYFLILRVCSTGTFPKKLSPEEEKYWIDRLKTGDKKAKNKLVEHNLRLVAHIIKKYYSVQSDQDDLVSIGTIGLIKSINTYDPDKNIKLSSYASKCIENEILMHFRNCRKSAQDVSLNESIDTDKDGNPLTLMDVMSVDDDIVETLDLKIKSEKISRYIDEVLDSREKKIIILRYGLNGCKPLTQREVAQKLDISRSYVSRIEKKAISLLRKRFDKGDNLC